MTARPVLPRKSTALLFFGLLAAGFLPAGGGPVAAQEVGGGPVVTDAENDVSALALNAGPAGANPAKIPGEGLDIRQLYFEEFDGNLFHAKIVFKNLKALVDDPVNRPNDVRGVPPEPGLQYNLVVVTCFKWRDTQYGARFELIVTQGTLATTRQTWGSVQSGCDGGELNEDVAFAKHVTNYTVALDLAGNAINLFLLRGGHDGVGGVNINEAALPPPKPGDEISDFYVRTFDKKTDTIPKARFDAAPDAGPGGTALVLAAVTANTDLVAAPEANAVSSASLRCGDLSDPRLFKMYGVPAGSKRGVPVTLRNLGTQPRNVNLTVVKVTGEDWKPRMMPQVRVPGATGDAPGNVSVNVIVDTPPGTTHKQCAVLRVRAVDLNQPDIIGETTFGVVATNPPSPAARTLYLHSLTGATVCYPDRAWLNTVATDPFDEGDDIKFLPCSQDPGGSLLGGGAGDFFTSIDVNPSHDLVLNTSAAGAVALAKIKFRSDSVPVRGKFLFEVTAGNAPGGRNPIGSVAVAKTIAATPTEVVAEIPIDFTREFAPEGDPSRVVEAKDPIGLHVQYAPDEQALPPDAFPTTLSFFLVPGGSTLELPIWAVVERNTVRAGLLGGLLSLVPVGELPKFAAPGLPQALNLEVYNQGATADAAVPSVNLTGPAGWSAAVFPSGVYELPAGERKAFTVVVTPPTTAKESEAVFVDITVTSQTDPTTQALLSHKLLATRSGEATAANVPTLGPGASKKGPLPGPELWLVALGVAAVVAAMRRRA